MILALQLISQATLPLTKAAGVRVLFAQISGDLLLDVLIGALLAVASYSSLAVVLLVASLTAANIVPAHVALPVVLGANLGSGLLAHAHHVEGGPGRAPRAARQLRVQGRGRGAGAPRAAARHAVPSEAALRSQAARRPLPPAVQRPARADLHRPDRSGSPTSRRSGCRRRARRRLPGEPRHLDPVALDTPALALGNAAREAIRLADTVQEMLTGLLEVLRHDSVQLAEALRRKDDEIDRLYSAIKRYLAQISREALEARESRRWTEIIQFTINMEHVGDIIERLLLDVAERKIQHGLSFSEAGLQEISDLHARLIGNLQLSVAVFLNGDLKSAQRLIAEKVTFRELEMRYAESHLLRLSENTPQSVETSSLHLDLLSDFKRINSLFCSVSYPILESAGVLSKTRVLAERGGALNPDQTPAAP